MNRFRRLVLWVLGIVFFWGGETAYALVNPNLPGISGAAGPIGIIQAFYNFSLMIGGLLAFIMILYAGVRYAASRGNPAGQSDAKDAITQALLGLLLLMGAYVILNTINPDLTNLRLPTLQALQAPPAPPPGEQPPPGSCSGGACVPIQGFSCSNGCTAAAPMVEKLNCISRAGVSGVVTEGMPPEAAHDSSCHNNGCCVDFKVSGGDCAAVSAAVRAASSCGATIKNEYPDCGGQRSPKWTGPHLHINGC